MTVGSTKLYDRILLRILRFISRRSFERILKNEIRDKLPLQEVYSL